MEPAQQVDKESEYYDYYFFHNDSGEDPIATFEGKLSQFSPISPLNYAYYQYAKGLLLKRTWRI